MSPLLKGNIAHCRMTLEWSCIWIGKISNGPYYKFRLGSTDLSCPVYMQVDLYRDQEAGAIYYKTLIPMKLTCGM